MNVLPGAPLSPQKEGEDSKMYISESIGNSQGMLIEISEYDAIAKIMIWVESDVSNIKDIRIISSKMKVSLLILSWWYFICLYI